MNLNLKFQKKCDQLFKLTTDENYEQYQVMLTEVAKDVYIQLLNATAIEDVYRLQGVMAVLDRLINFPKSVRKELEIQNSPGYK